MSVKIENTSVTKLSAKGILKEWSEEGFVITDEKEGFDELLSKADIKSLLGKSVTIVFQNKEKDD
jgi:hypothetical protein